MPVGVRWGPLGSVVEGCGGLWRVVDGCGRYPPGVEAPSPKHAHASDSVRRQIEPNTPDDPKGSADFEAPGIRIDGFGGSRHQHRWIWRLQASKSMDLEAPGMKIDGLGGSRHENRWIWRLQTPIPIHLVTVGKGE